MTRIRQRRVIRSKLRAQLKWLVPIAIAMALLAALISLNGGVVSFIEHFFSYEYTAYRPMDVERRWYETNRARVPEQTRSSQPDAYRRQ